MQPSDMKLEIFNDDPLKVLASSKPVVENARFVFIDDGSIKAAAKAVAGRFNEGPGAEEMGLKATKNIEEDVQLVFLEDVVNFCFWAPKDGTKWSVEDASGLSVSGGWFALKNCFDRALAEGLPILDASYLSTIGLGDVRRFFRGANGVEIPLLEGRADNFREAGRVLLEKYGGKFINLIESANHNASVAVRMIVDDFSSFRDISKFDAANVYFLKRAQICCHDLDCVFKTKGKRLAETGVLTAFADYKVPQILRMFGVLNYESTLAEKVDAYVELPHDGREEIEIRAASIWAVELMRQELPKFSAVDIDNALWLMSQSIQSQARPYHRTKTIFY